MLGQWFLKSPQQVDAIELKERSASGGLFSEGQEEDCCGVESLGTVLLDWLGWR